MEDARHITSTANPLVKRLRGLALKKHRDEDGLFLVEGERHIAEALEAGWDLRVLAYSGKAPASIAAMRRKMQSAEVYTVTGDILTRITGRDNAQPCLAAFAQRYAAPEAAAQGLWIGLEGIRDPGNLGTIIRSCEAAGAAGVMLVGATCDPWSPEAVRASVGSFARVPLAVLSLPQFMAWRAAYAGQVIGTHLRTETDFRAADYAAPALIMMGGEKEGLSDTLAAACGQLVRIPMQGAIESLNLGVAAALMLYEARRGAL